MLINAWTMLARRYANAPNILGADLYNEPFGATWGDGSATDWRLAAQRIGNAIHSTGVIWLIFVQGIADTIPSCGANPCFWGASGFQRGPSSCVL